LEVIDRIEADGAVADGGTADARASVERALRANKSLAAYRLEVREENGRLVLRGHVRTGAEKDLAAALAREAARRPVENGLDVQLCRNRPPRSPPGTGRSALHASHTHRFEDPPARCAFPSGPTPH